MVMLISGILCFICGVLSTLLFKKDRDNNILSTGAMLSTILVCFSASIVLIFTGIVYSFVKVDYKVVEVEHLSHSEVRVFVENDEEIFWIIFDENEYNNEKTLTLTQRELEKYYNNKK